MPTDKDNWEHGSDNMRCKGCMFFVPKGDGTVGRCREKSPTIKGFPAVFPDDWCGAHKIDAEKLTEKIICYFEGCNKKPLPGVIYCKEHFDNL